MTYYLEVKDRGTWVPYNWGVGAVRSTDMASKHTYDEASYIARLLEQAGLHVRLAVTKP